ncbi:hypothetical protein [Caulobacter sp. LjRoot300]|uniref:hypothetical protein n=1 Tax=Caulobacter sp. LjRoot300 TaxID=3342321 RepID=UPI003ED12206
MTFAKLFGTATLAFAALSLAAAAPASARERDMHHRGEHKVCKWERHHGHKQKVCRWVRSLGGSGRGGRPDIAYGS